MHYGIDISSNNPHPIDFAKAYADLHARGGGEQPFCIVKATQGTGYTNPDFAADIAAARAAGFAVGAYLMDEGAANVTAEEQYFRAVVGPVPQFNDLELPDGLSAAGYAAHCAQLVAQNPGAPDYMNQSEEDEGFPPGAGIWEANYNRQPGVVHRPALMHQYDDAGTVAGIVGQVDLDCWLGTEAQFAAMFAGATTIPATPAFPSKEDYMNKLVQATNPATGKTAQYAIRATDVIYADDGTVSNWAYQELNGGTGQLEAVPAECILWWNGGKWPVGAP